MDALLRSLLFLVIDTYVILLFVRMFAASSERYDSVLGLVFRATDGVVTPLAAQAGRRYAPWVPLLLICALLIVKGLLLRSIPAALQGFTDTLLQLYVLIFIIISAIREFYVNPIASFGQRIVRPIRTMVTTVSQHRPTVNLLAVVGLVVVHVLATMLLSGLFGSGVVTVKQALVHSLGLILNLTQFFFWVIFINALLSWVSPDPLNPVVQLMALLSAPVVDPIRRITPPLGGALDFSPMIALFLLMILNRLGHELLHSL
jgi:YggT family protein